MIKLNRTQALVLVFFAVAWISLALILAIAPEVYDEALRLRPQNRQPVELAFLVALAGLLALLGTGVIRCWPWVFWLVLIAFLAGALRPVTSFLELVGVLRTTSPTWYVLFQALIGIVQLSIGLAMLKGYRNAGVWADF